MIKHSTLKINQNDNVAVALNDLKIGEVNIDNKTINLNHFIPQKHKFSLEKISKGCNVIFYGVIVGIAKEDIYKGDLISTSNVAHHIEGEIKFNNSKSLNLNFNTEKYKDKTFLGYNRGDQVGTENNWLFFPLVFCQNKNIETLKDIFMKEFYEEKVSEQQLFLRDLINENNSTDIHFDHSTKSKSKKFENIDVKFITHSGGCGETRQDSATLGRLLAGYVNNPNVDKLIIIPKEKNDGIFNTLRIGLSLIKEDIEIFYTLTDSLRSSIIMWLSKSKKRVGYNTQGRGIFLTDKIVFPEEKIHRSLKYLRLIGEEQLNKDEKFIFIDNDELIWARKEIDEIGVKSPVALFPFSISSSRTFPEKKILEWIKDSDENYLIFGSSDDRQKASIIANNNDMKITSICGNYSLRKSIILMSLCKYAIAADSGLGHISSIVGVPTISFFGAKRSSITGPIGNNCIIIDKSHRCKPCKKNTCFW